MAPRPPLPRYHHGVNTNEPRKPGRWTVRGVAGAAARVVAVICCVLSLIAIPHLVMEFVDEGVADRSWFQVVGDAAWTLSFAFLVLMAGLYVLSRPRER